jgi:hypothetical protein
VATINAYEEGERKVQRAIAGLIKAEPRARGPTSTSPSGSTEPPFSPWRKKSKGRALGRMRLPGTWTVMQAVCFNDRRFWLYDPCRLEAWRKIASPHCDPSHWRPGGTYYGWCEEAKTPG